FLAQDTGGHGEVVLRRQADGDWCAAGQRNQRWVRDTDRFEVDDLVTGVGDRRQRQVDGPFSPWRYNQLGAGIYGNPVFALHFSGDGIQRGGDAFGRRVMRCAIFNGGESSLDDVIGRIEI